MIRLEYSEEKTGNKEPNYRLEVDKGKYRHSKSGKLYEVIGLALETETEEFLVIYRPFYESEYELFARPVNMFMETVVLDGKSVPRFEKLNN